ncbi:type IV toxin-antitoxin system AbiEi family antitoxin [Salinibacter altiplanensis]|uniref:type IV toxin-antitoxin system AbiEi family antitoxin n=1 Tax=Salinibacter altiplanensis TaxID=1803181 RepID=UPI000C9FA8D1|nr:type IV toxin-antitoxin system AbiEi family antitoxin [Salinibacter altiplanensis]
MESARSEAVDRLQSIIGPEAVLRVKGSEGEIRVLNQKTNSAWFFNPIGVRRLNRNCVAHTVNRLEELSRDNTNSDGKEVESLLISDHVTAGAGEFLREEGISYLDASGNCFLQSSSLLLFVQGQNSKSRSQSSSLQTSTSRGKTKSIRAFNSAGLKLIFILLAWEDAIDKTYRDLASLVDISRGAVGYVFNDLTELGFIEERKRGRQLRKQEELIDRWATGYTERLRSELSRGRFQFLHSRKATGWQSHLSQTWATRWGGEPGADLLTGNFRPELLTVYTREATSTICRNLEAAPDPEGSIEILDMFWDPVELNDEQLGKKGTAEHVPPLLIYADLIASADARARRAAKRIWDQYLMSDSRK